MPPSKKTSTTGIPVKAAPRPSAISTPLPTGAVPDKKGIVTTTLNNIEIKILPDKIVTRLSSPNASGETEWKKKTGLTWVTKPDPTDKTKKTKLIKSFILTPLQVTISTIYKKGVNPLANSAYGRGTTPSDIAAGRISLQFHEGSHGTRALRFFIMNDPPVFGGKIDMTETAFKAAWATYQTELKTYFDELELRERRDVDCVGTPYGGTFDKKGTTCSTLATPNPKYDDLLDYISKLLKLFALIK
jgi:hypothetical protein